MKKSFLPLLLLFFLFTTLVHAQKYFEGQIEYKIEYEILNQNIPETYLKEALGDAFTAYVKEDKYIMVYNSNGDLGWRKTTIRLDEGFAYTEYERSDTIFKRRLDTKKDSLIEIRRHSDDKKMILGEMCEYVSLKYSSPDVDAPFNLTNGRHYFNPKYRLNPKKYKNYHSGFWNLYVKEAEAISIRNEHLYAGLFISISEAVEVKEEEIPDSLFELDENKIIKAVE